MSNTTNGDIPKIQLESKSDVDYLQSEFTKYLHSQPTPSTLRTANLSDKQYADAQNLVRDQLDTWASRVWLTAGDSIQVNGLAYGDAMRAHQQRHEAFDEALAHEVEQLRAEVDELMIAVAEKRRTVPAQIERLCRDYVDRSSRAAESSVLELADAEEAEEACYLSDRVAPGFEKAVRMANGLRERVPAAVERARELCETVAGVAEDERARSDRTGGEGDRAVALRAAMRAISDD